MLAEALSEYEALCTLEPTRADYLARAADLSQRLGDNDAARSFARRAVAVDPNSPAAALLPSAP